MTIINIYWLGGLLGPLVGLGDGDEEDLRPYDDFDPDNEDQVRDLIRREFVPNFEAWDEESQQAAKDSLAWYLSFEPDRLERVLSASILPFEVPRFPELFWQRFWQELFGPEDFHLRGDPRSFEVNDDPEAPRLMRVRNRKPAD